MKKFFFTAFIISLFIISPVYALPPGGGAENFTELDDAPTTYSGQTGKYIKVNVAETGLEFGVPPGGGDMLAATFDADSNDAIDLNRGGTNAALTDPGADRIMFWRESANAVTWLTLGNGFVINTTTLNLDLTPTAGSATLWYNDDALEVKYDGDYFGEGANGLILDLTPSSGFATLQMANDAVGVKYDTALFDESADGLTLDITPSSGFASLQSLNDSLQVKYDSSLTTSVSGLGVSNTLTNSNLAADAAISLSKLASGTSAQIIVANGSGVPTYVAMSGDATISNTGAISIGANKITGTHISLPFEETGSLMNYNASSGYWEVLNPGTSGYPLISNGTGAASSYSKLSATGIADNTITNGQILGNTIRTNELAETLIFSDGDLIDLSGITPSAGVDEGLVLPTWANVTPASDKPFIAYDPASNSLKVYEGGWVTIGASGASGAPTDATYLTVSLDGTLTNERSLSAGLGIGATDGGVNSTYTLTFAPEELGNLTWGTGSAATQVWTFNNSGATDPVLTAGDGYISVTTGELRESTRRVYSVGGTDVAVADGGTNKSSWTQYAIPYLSATTTFSEIAIGTAGYTLNVNGTTNGYTWTAPLTMDTITDGSSYQKIAAADVNASGHLDRFYTALGTGYITISGPTSGYAKAFSNGAATVMEEGVSHGGLIFGDSTPDAAGEIGYATGKISFYNGSAAVDLVSEGVATGGLIFGDSTPDAAGEIGYASNVISYYDGTAARTLATLETAQTISGVKRIADNTNFSFGTDADWSVYYDETTSDNLVFSTAKIGAADTASGMFKILVNSGAGTLTASQNVFNIVDNTTSLLKVDASGNLTIPGTVTSGSTTGNSYISMGGNLGGRAPGGATSYEIYFDGGTDLKYSLGLSEKTIARLEDAQTFTGAKTFTGGIYAGDASTLGGLRLYDGSSNYWLIQPQAISSDYTLVLPSSAGTTGQYLTTTTSGGTATLSWGTPSATAAGATAGMVQYNASGSGGALAGDAGFIFTAATDTLTLGESGAAGKLVETDGTHTATIQQGTQSTDAVITLPIVTSTLATNDTLETISGQKTFSAATTVSKVNSASGSANALTLSGTLAAFNGSDTFRGLYLNYTNANHTGTSNTVALIDVSAITGDANSNLYAMRIGALTGTTGAAGEVEHGIDIGAGWDYGIYNASTTYLGAATTFAGGSEDLTLTVGGSSNLAAFSTSTGVDTLNFTSINLGSTYHQPESLSNGSTALRSGQTNTNTVKIQAYDTDGSWADLITGTSSATPTLTLAAAGGIAISNTMTFNSNPRIYDGDSNYATFDAPDISGDITITLPSTTSTLATVNGALGTPSFTALNLPSSNADPGTTAGQIRHDSTVTNFANGAVRWYDGTNIRQMVDIVAATAEACGDTYVVAYSATNDNFYCKADETGGSTTINNIGDASADGTIDQTGYKQTWTSTLNSAGAVWTFTNTTADLTADVSFMDFKYTDDGDANGYFLRGYDNSGNDIKWYIGANGDASFGSTITTASANDPYIYFNETDGTDWWVGLNDTANTLEFRTNATVGSNVQASISEAGVLQITSVSLGNTETITNADDTEIAFNGTESIALDLDTGTANQVAWKNKTTGSSDVTDMSFSSLNLATTGTITGAIKTEKDDDTLAAGQMYGTFHWYSGGAETITLPAAVVGMNACFYSSDASVKNIDPNGTDTIVLTTAALTAGYQIESPGAAGDFICLVCFTANQWTALGRSGTWVSHGAD